MAARSPIEAGSGTLVACAGLLPPSAGSGGHMSRPSHPGKRRGGGGAKAGSQATPHLSPAATQAGSPTALTKVSSFVRVEVRGPPFPPVRYPGGGGGHHSTDALSGWPCLSDRPPVVVVSTPMAPREVKDQEARCCTAGTLQAGHKSPPPPRRRCAPVPAHPPLPGARLASLHPPSSGSWASQGGHDLHPRLCTCISTR